MYNRGRWERGTAADLFPTNNTLLALAKYSLNDFISYILECSVRRRKWQDEVSYYRFLLYCLVLNNKVAVVVLVVKYLKKNTPTSFHCIMYVVGKYIR